MSNKEATRKREKKGMPKIKEQAKQLKIKAQDKKIAGDPQSIQSFPNKKSTAKFTLKQLGDTAMMVPELIKILATGKMPEDPQVPKMINRAKEFKENRKYYKNKKAGGGMTGVGLYPAEMARAGTMSQAKRKRYMKKGGGISYKMSGGQVVSHGYDK